MSIHTNDTVPAENQTPAEEETEASTAPQETANFPAGNRLGGHSCC